MADAPNTFATLNGMFKTVYADKLLELVPDYAILQNLVDFVSADKETGNYYAQPVVLTQENGFTYIGEDTAGTTASTLGDAIAGASKEAQVYGSQLVLRSQLSYGALARASKAGEKAFKRVSAWKVEDMNNSMRKRLEIAMLYGQSGLGTVLTNTTGALVLTEASWAGGIWSGLEGAQLEAFTGITSSETQHNGTLTISAVDHSTRTVTVTGTSSAVVANDVLYFKGARTTTAFKEMAGLHKILSNTGVLFNISATTYSLWKGTTASSVGQISFAKVQDALAKAVNKGLMGKVLCLVSPRAWSVLNADQAALRVYDSSYGKAQFENGAEALTFYGPNGKIEVRSHPFMKDGDFMCLPMDNLIRVGSTDLTFGVPGMDEEFFQFVPAVAAVELQCFCDQAIFLEKPAQGIYGSGLTYA